MFGSVRGGMHVHEARWLLSEFGTWKETRRVAERDRDIEEFARRHPEGSYVVVLDALFESGHLVAVVDGKILGEYRGDWTVTGYWRKVE